MTNKEQILNLIKEELNADESIISWHYAGTVPCHKCPFEEECRKDKESVGSSKCAVILNNKLQEDKEKMEDQEIKEDEDQSVKPEFEPTSEWYEKELFELRAKITELEFEKGLLLLQVMKLSNNDPKNCY